MGGFFGIVSRQDCMVDVFFGVDYHSHLGTRRGGMAAYDKDIGLQREIHNIENSPFRTKFEHVFEEMSRVIINQCISPHFFNKTDFGILAHGNCTHDCLSETLSEQRD